LAGVGTAEAVVVVVVSALPRLLLSFMGTCVLESCELGGRRLRVPEVGDHPSIGGVLPQSGLDEFTDCPGVDPRHVLHVVGVQPSVAAVGYRPGERHDEQAVCLV
jgi:hypothetical protein